MFSLLFDLEFLIYKLMIGIESSELGSKLNVRDYFEV